MINFILPFEHNCYFNVMQLYIKNIVRDNEDYNTSHNAIADCVNVHFFLEPKILEAVGMVGTNVFICHGIADKNYRIMKTLQLFDYIIVTGPTWRDRLISKGISPDKIFVGGYVKIDHLFNMQVSRRHIVWAPTHNVYHTKSNLSSYPALLPTIKRNPGIRCSLHPANNPEHSYTDTSLLNAAAVIADSGSTLYEAWALDIPVVFPSWIVKTAIMRHFKGSLEAEIYSKLIGYHVYREASFGGVLKMAVDNGIDKQAQQFIEGLYPRGLRGRSGELTWKILQEVLSCKQ